MAGIRENILSSPQVRDDFFDAMLALDQTNSGVMASDLRKYLQANQIPLHVQGREQELSTYDIFVFWHVVAMSMDLPPGNAAHGGPIFLAWHRMYLIRIEEMCQQVLGKPDFGLPYWDWAADGELPAQDQWRTDLWREEYLGEARGRVRTGRLSEFPVRIHQHPITGVLHSIDPRPIERSAGLHPLALDLPTKPQEQFALAQTVYDQPDWDVDAISHRNILEGWINAPQLHNRVHVWVGGDMAPGTSPNDPVFFLNHCNVDRLWEQWMGSHGRVYSPSRGRGPQGHRIDSSMFAMIGDAMIPEQVLDPAQWYSYDHQLVA
jgi:tyrosinase